MHVLFPADPLHPRQADAAYAEEFEAFRALDSGCALFSFEDFEAGTFKPRPALPPQARVLYRGWMLPPERYALLHAEIVSQGAIPIITPVQYHLCHHLPAWYPLCREFTPETIVLPRNADFVAALAGIHWHAYFVKDYVKSLSTAQGSVAATPQDIARRVAALEHYRGSIEGGLCIRRFENLHPDSEERYFAVNGAAHAREGSPPPLAQTLAQRIDSPFFSIDLAEAENGDLRLIELGDGQVSDHKRWPVDRFAALLSRLQAPMQSTAK